VVGAVVGAAAVVGPEGPGTAVERSRGATVGAAVGVAVGAAVGVAVGVATAAVTGAKGTSALPLKAARVVPVAARDAPTAPPPTRAPTARASSAAGRAARLTPRRGRDRGGRAPRPGAATRGRGGR